MYNKNYQTQMLHLVILEIKIDIPMLFLKVNKKVMTYQNGLFSLKHGRIIVYIR